MTDHWDEFSKSLAAKSVPRRQSLRLLGAAVAGALLSPLGVRTAWAAGRNPCQSFCKCGNKQQQNACLAACRACNGDTSRLCGSCGSYACTDLGFDFDNCGACGHACQWPGPYEEGACMFGRCEYACTEGAVDCGDGACTALWADPNNCGGCGVVCADGELCSEGACAPAPCGGGGVYCPHVPPTFGPGCTFLAYDNYNCGACGHYCSICNDGVCDDGSPPPDYP